MKKYLVLAVLFLVSFVFSSCVPIPTETVYEGDLEIWNPFDLISVSNYTSITGNLVIYQGTPYVEQTALIKLTNLNAFRNLTHVGGNLVIEHCPRLKDLDGLKNLKSIGGSLSIYANDKLKSLEGLQNLTSVGEDIHIVLNESLTSFAGLEKITSIGGSLIIHEPFEAFSSLEGLNNITSIGGDLL